MQMDSPNSAVVRVCRPRRTRHFRAPYRVAIDGEVAAHLNVGDECSVDVAPGHHEVRILLGKSYESAEWGVDLRAGEVGRFECRACGSALMTSFNVLAGKPHVDLHPVE